MFLYNKIFLNSLVFIKGEFFYKVRTKLRRKLHSMIIHILMSWFKTFDSKLKTQNAQKDKRLVFQKKLKKTSDIKPY